MGKYDIDAFVGFGLVNGNGVKTGISCVNQRILKKRSCLYRVIKRMRIVSLTIPKPTLSNEEDIKSISLTIKSRNNGMQMIDTWPHAIPRYRFDLDEILEISVYYKLKDSFTKTGSDEIHLHSVVHFPCVLLDEIEQKGKKQWILGLDRFSDSSSTLITETCRDQVLRQIKVMEEKAKKSFQISKVYLIFYSCSRTILNIEEQLNLGHSSAMESQAEHKSGSIVMNALLSKDSRSEDRVRNQSFVGIRPEDSISRVSAKTNHTNTLTRTNLIKQNLTENCDNLSDAIEMINKYRTRSKIHLSRPRSSDHEHDHHQQGDDMIPPALSNVNRSRQHPKSVKELSKDGCDDAATSSKPGEVGPGSIAAIDTASIISKAISTNTHKYLEKKEQQERLLKMQYCFSIWLQATRKEKRIKMSRRNSRMISGILCLLRIFDRNQMSKKMYFVNSLRANYYSGHLKKRDADLEQVHNEKSILAEKLNALISDNCGKLQKLNDCILMKERDVFELRKKLEYYDNLNGELRNQLDDVKFENRRLASQINELNDYIKDREKLVESEKLKSDKERQELEIIIDRRKKDYTRQLEEIHFLNAEISELKSMVSAEKEEKGLLVHENEELSKKLLSLEEEKMTIMNDFNQSIIMKSRENEKLYLENVKYKEDNELLIRNNNKLTEEKSSYMEVFDELKNEKSCLIKSVYDLINQIENEKIERIQELENSRILFQSINNRSNYTERQMLSLYHSEGEYDNDDLKLDDLKTIQNKKEKIIKEFKSFSRVDEILVEILDKMDRNLKLVRLDNINIIQEQVDIKVKTLVKEVNLEFFDDEYENIKLKNEQIMDLSERVRILSDEMNKLKEREKDMGGVDILKENIMNNGMSFDLDDTDKMIGSATEMFRLALKNLRLNHQGFESIESERPKSSTFGIVVEENSEKGIKAEEITRNDDLRIKEQEEQEQDKKLMMIVPSEFSFSSNHCNINMTKKSNDDERLESYHQYSIENKTNLNPNNNDIKLNERRVVSSSNLTSTNSGSCQGSLSVSRIGSGNLNGNGNEMNFSQMTKNNPIIVQFPMIRSSSLSSPTQSPALLSRSNSMRYYNGLLSSSKNNHSSNNNNNIGGYYYQYYNTRDLYSTSNKNILNVSSFIGENNSQKRYNSLPRQNIRTIPPPFFPRS
ncbi:hypothetical protein OJ253_2087 [Cryptosporidium canis]|uniref:C2 NT-type domain-containing protein n=1 Tax=Cryptosporidium canis TaxID=195482 RepID=A0A9D5DFX5_9CRYT|nr:hypothetical protein OJ253_2087 [Cryptosporidium canis]